MHVFVFLCCCFEDKVKQFKAERNKDFMKKYILM